MFTKARVEKPEASESVILYTELNVPLIVFLIREPVPRITPNPPSNGP